VKSSAHRRILAGVIGLAASMALVLTGQAQASAVAGKPAPIDPRPAGSGTLAARSSATTAAPDRRRSPGLKALLSAKDADRGADDPALSALAIGSVGTNHPHSRRNEAVDVSSATRKVKPKWFLSRTNEVFKP